MTRGISRQFPQGGSGNSFSLVEMLVAMAIMSIIVIVLLGMTTSMMSTWQFGQGRNERRDVGQAALERMSRDLRLTTLPLSRSGATNLQFVINPAGVTATTYEFPQAVFWQAPVAADGGNNGNLAVVGYFIQWVGNKPSLCRLLINPSTTGATGYNVYSNPTSWIGDSYIATNAPATSTSGYAGVLADNIIGLWVQALDPMGNPIQQTGLAAGSFDSRVTYSYTNFVSSVPITNRPPVLPSSVQIAVMVLDARTAKRLTGSEKPLTSSLTGNFWADIQSFTATLPASIQKGAEVQTIRVEMAGGPR